MVVFFPHHPKAAMNKMSIWRGYKIKCQWIFSWFGFPNTQTGKTFRVISVYIIATGVSGNSRSRPFSEMKASNSRSRIIEINFSFPSRSPTLGMFFSFPYQSQIEGMNFIHSLPVSKFTISQTGITTGIGILRKISDFQYFQPPLHFLKQFLLRR